MKKGTSCSKLTSMLGVGVSMCKLTTNNNSVLTVFSQNHTLFKNKHSRTNLLRYTSVFVYFSFNFNLTFQQCS